MEPHLDAFQTTWHTASGAHYRGYLTTSPEYAMKKLLAAGIAPIFQICKSFRDGEEVSARHNPEFTILEWYRANADYHDLMRDCEDLIREIAGVVRRKWRGDGASSREFQRSVPLHGPREDGPHPNPLPAGRGDRMTWIYQGEAVDLMPPWDRLTVREAFERYAGIDVFVDENELRNVAAGKGYAIAPGTTWEQIYHQIFLNEVEPRLGRGRPTILYDYPVAMAALSRARPDDPSLAERFEVYVAGLELANAFGELTDPAEQLRRLRAEQLERRALGKTAYDVDDDFIRALERGIPPSAGIALGVDRLAMFFADVTTIGEVLWFPADELFHT
jgi:lysyl-tRNA synthetase class 2